MVWRVRDECLVGQCLVLPLLHVQPLISDLRHVHRHFRCRFCSICQWFGDSRDQDDCLRVNHVWLFEDPSWIFPIIVDVFSSVRSTRAPSRVSCVVLELFPKYGNKEACKREILSGAAATSLSVALFEGSSIRSSDYARDKPTGTATTKLYAAEASPGIHRAIWQLSWALIIQITLVVSTIRTNIPSGLIVSSISIGVIAGRLFGVITEQIAFKNQHLAILRHESGVSNEHCVTPGLYGVVGVCTFLGGVSRMTVSHVVTMSEVTNGPSYIVPLMIVALTDTWVDDAFVEGIDEENVKTPGISVVEESRRLSVYVQHRWSRLIE